MPTYLELQQEAEWLAEIVPPSLKALALKLRAFYHVDASAIGSKGNNVHLRGYHRSRNWIKNSRYCTNRTYSVTETLGNRSGGDGDWICAMDITIPRDQLISMCQRLDKAVRTGQLEKVTEWYGNKDGDEIVDGYNNIADRVARSDSSHLWHAHISFDRGRANEDHTDLYEILTGTGDDFMSALTDAQQQDLYRRVMNVDSFLYYGYVQGLEEIPAGTVRLGFGVGTATTAATPVVSTKLLKQISTAATIDVDELAIALHALLPPGTLTEAAVQKACEAAVRAVAADAATADG